MNTKKTETSDVDYLTKQINKETSEYGEAYPFAFFIRDDDSNIIAGANGFVIYGAIYTDQLWVDKDYRGQGFAKKIMGQVHEFAKLEGCKIATVQTMSFQGAQSFYKKLGYVVELESSGYRCLLMKKEL